MSRTGIYLVLGGGGSLGAYTAGALTALYEALQDSEENGGGEYEIRGIVGASAGALAGALFARALVTNEPGRALENLRRAWVDVFDLEALIGLPPKEVQPLGLFHAEGIVKEFQGMLEAPNPGGSWPLFTASPLKMAFETTNPQGIPYTLGVAQGRSVPLLSHRDRLRFDLRNSASSGTEDDVWKDIGTKLPASSAMPFFYPPRFVDRQQARFPGSALEEDLCGEPCVDGGLTSNEPVEAALDLIREEPEKDDSNPIIVIIDPKTDCRTEIEQPLTALRVAVRSSAAIVREAGHGDWLTFSNGVQPPPDVELWAIHPEKPLAGEFWLGFGGLFDRRWREHDFAAGIADATKVFSHAGLGSENGVVSPEAIEPKPAWGLVPVATKLRLCLWTSRRLWRMIGRRARWTVRVILLGTAAVGFALGFWLGS